MLFHVYWLFSWKKKIKCLETRFFRFAKSSICICTYDIFHVSQGKKQYLHPQGKKQYLQR